MSTTTLPLGGDPDFAALHAFNAQRYPFLLTSTARADELGRYEILFAFPGRVIEAGGERDFLDQLDEAFLLERADTLPGLPFTGGWFLYLGYELAAEIEPGLTFHKDPVLPAAFAVRCPAALVRDLDTGTVVLALETGADIDFDALRNDLDNYPAAPPRGSQSRVAALDEEDPVRFLDAVRTAREHIAAGDIYQANLSREWRIRSDEHIDAVALFRALADANPAPFAGIAHWRGKEIVSSSPERLLCVRDGYASTRPIAGTRPRSEDPDTDQALLEELIAHPKERAEHVMLIDLERNDLGKICAPGTVDVNEMMVIESYAHVHHIVSNVRGRVRDDVLPGDAIRAIFPGGTITGCPKVRCMEIISELEDGPRGAYTGSFGYLNRDGSLDLNILIRSIVVDGAVASFRAGAGIVADSAPEAELAETRAKAEGLVRALSR